MTQGRHQAPELAVAVSLRQAGQLLARGVAAMLVAGTAMFMLAAAGGIFLLHASVAPILTGSMRGTFDPGSAVLTRPVATSSIRPGDVIVFTPPGHVESYAHRVLSVTGPPTAPVITTKGDANPLPDPWRARLTDPVAHRVIASAPELGRVIVALHQPGTRSVALALAGLVFTVFGVRAVLASSSARPGRPQLLPAPSPAS